MFPTRSSQKEGTNKINLLNEYLYLTANIIEGISEVLQWVELTLTTCFFLIVLNCMSLFPNLLRDVNEWMINNDVTCFSQFFGLVMGYEVSNR